MSILLDQLVEESKEMSPKTMIDGKWYIAMPIQITGIFALFTTIKSRKIPLL